MEDIVFKPKYKATFWFLYVLLIVLAVLVLGAGVMMALVALQRPLQAEETIIAVSFFIMFALITLCSLNLIIKRIAIERNGMSVTTLLGTVRRRPFAPEAYYEQGCLIINGFVISGGFFKNTDELDGALKKLSAKGKIKYVREKGVLASRPLGYSMVMLISACILGILFGTSLGMLQIWIYMIAMDAAFFVWLVYTFNKLPRANKGILDQLKTYFG